MRFLSLLVFVFAFVAYCHGVPFNLDSLDTENGGDRRMLSDLDDIDTNMESSPFERRSVQNIISAAAAQAAAQAASQAAAAMHQQMMLSIQMAKAKLNQAKNARDRARAQQALNNAKQAIAQQNKFQF